MKKMLVLMFTMLMSVNCKAQIPWAKLIEIAGTIISAGSSLASNLNSTHTKELNKGIELCEINDYKRALDFLTLINEDDYDAVRVEAFFYRGICYMGLEEYDIAIKLFDKAINFETTFFTFEKDKIKKFQEEMKLLKAITYAKALNSQNSDNFIKGMINTIALHRAMANTDSDASTIYKLLENYGTKAINYFSNVNQNDKTLLRVMAYCYMGECRTYQYLYRNIFAIFTSNDNATKEKFFTGSKEVLLYYEQATNITTSQDDKYRDEIIKYQIEAQNKIDYLQKL